MDRKNKEKQLINKRWKTAQIQQELGFCRFEVPFLFLLPGRRSTAILDRQYLYTRNCEFSCFNVYKPGFGELNPWMICG
jgi:hypothetical protein